MQNHYEINGSHVKMWIVLEYLDGNLYATFGPFESQEAAMDYQERLEKIMQDKQYGTRGLTYQVIRLLSVSE